MASTKRIGWIVSLRAFAAMAIVLLHTISTWTVENAGGGRPEFDGCSMALLFKCLFAGRFPVL